MSVDVTSERVCYVQCNLCNTILAVGVPHNNLFNVVTVRCGHCASLLSVNIGGLQQTLPFEDLQYLNHNSGAYGSDYASSSKCSRISVLDHSSANVKPQTFTVNPPEKRQRAPSAYNKFIKDEIQRIKASNPNMTHREAFSTAAKNWAHFPHIHFGLTFDGNTQAKNDGFVGEEGKKTHGFY